MNPKSLKTISRPLLTHTSNKLKVVSGTSGDKVFELTGHQSRENCHCPECLLYPSRHRRNYAVNKNVAIKNVKWNDLNEDQIMVKWSDNHEGYLSLSQLNDVPTLLNEKSLLWDKSTFDEKRFDYQTLMNDKNEKSKFFDQFNRFGLCIIENAPYDDECCVKFCDAMELNRYDTHHGRSFVVENSNVNVNNKHEKANQAYTDKYLAAHTDLPYMVDIPHGFVFHCLNKAPIGGESFYVDGWNIASYMKSNHKQEYDLLCKIPILFRDNQKQIEKGNQAWDIYAMRPTISQYPSMRIAYNNGVRYSLHWALNELNELDELNETELSKVKDDTLEAMQLFGQLTEKDDFRFEYQMKSGDMNVFNNYRVLHGRRQFEGNRKMAGIYFQYTEFVTQHGAPLELPNPYNMAIYPQNIKTRMSSTI